MMLATSLLVSLTPQGPIDLEALLRADQRCAPIVAKAREHRLQVLVSVPVVAADGAVRLERSYLGDPSRYWYPASSIKLCGAVALLQRLQTYNQEHGTALGLDSAPNVGVVDPGQELDGRGVIGAALDGERTLRDLRDEQIGVEPLVDPVPESDPVQPGRSRDDGVDLADLRQPGRHVAAEPDEVEVGSERGELGLPADGPGGHHRALRQPGKGRATERITHVGALREGRDDEAVG